MSKSATNSVPIKPIFKSIPPSAVHDAEGEVRRLISSGKCKQAVEAAKEYHKKTNTLESEKLVFDAYVSRVAQFRESNQVENARTLIPIVKEKCPHYAGLLADEEVRTAAAGGRIDDLVAPLARPDVADSQRDAIESSIRQQLIDVESLATCTALPDTHPLRVAAGAVWRAFEAVTAGPVTDEQIALAEVSRRSPLVGWRMLIRAIAAFHRNEDDACRRALEAIPPDAAAARLGMVLLDILSGKPADRGAVGALQTRMAAGDGALRTAVAALEQAFLRDYAVFTQETATALRACEAARPELTEKFRQRLMVRCIVSGLELREVNRILGMTDRDAAFWKALARGCESTGQPAISALAWERFIAHGVAEKMFSPEGIESAVIRGHVARMLFPHCKDAFGLRMDTSPAKFHGGYYLNQPPHIMVQVPKDPAQTCKQALDPELLARRSLALLPDADLYREWDAWACSIERPVKEQEDICLAWHKAFPRDITPPLRLSLMAEERNALSMAQKRLAQAEAIDPFNPAVRKARSRLILATFWKHMKDGKSHLAEKDLADLAKIDTYKDGDSNAILQAMWCALHILHGRLDQARAAADAVCEKVGALAGKVVLESILLTCGVNPSAFSLTPAIADPQPLAVAEADARLIRLFQGLGIGSTRPRGWTALECKVFKQRPCPLKVDDILLLGRALLMNQCTADAYLATSAALDKSTGVDTARVLMLRACILLMTRCTARTEQCLRAARGLARQVHDADLLAEITKLIARLPYGLTPLAEGDELGDESLAKIVAAERRAGTMPNNNQANMHLVPLKLQQRFRPFGMDNPFGVGPEALDDLYDEIEDDDDDGVDDDDSFNFGRSPGGYAGIPTELLPLLTRILNEYGGDIPDPERVAREHPELAQKFAEFLHNRK